MNATTAVKRGVLGESLDQLFLQRDDLDETLARCNAEREAAEDGLSAARDADRAAYAEALRQPDAKNPGQVNTGIAEQRLSDALLALDALREAFATCESDIAATLADRLPELRELVTEKVERARTKALGHLEEASKEAAEFVDLTTLLVWVEKPTRPSGDTLRPYNVPPVHVNAFGPGRQQLTLAQAVDAVGKRLEDGSAESLLLKAGREARVPADRIEHIEGRALNYGKTKITDLSKLGVTRLRVTRNGLATDLVVASKTLEEMQPVDLLRENAEAIDAAFDKRQPVVEVTDPEAKRLLDSVAVEVSPPRLSLSEHGDARAARERRPATNEAGAQYVLMQPRPNSAHNNPVLRPALPSRVAARFSPRHGATLVTPRYNPVDSPSGTAYLGSVGTRRVRGATTIGCHTRSIDGAP